MSAHYSHLSGDDLDLEGDDLSLNLVGPARGGPVLQAPSLLSVVAPATLPEGYQLEATIGSSKYKVTVPMGGVEEGQTFQVPLPQQMANTMSIPVGHWRDALFGCWNYGPCHPHWWTGLCCTLLAAAQIIRRLKLTALGQPGTVAKTEIAFKIIFMALVVYIVLYWGMYFVIVALYPASGRYDEMSTLCATLVWLRSVWHYIYIIFLTVILYNLRGYIRKRYAIPGSQIQDCCCSFWCPCLVVTQMMRHTTDYDIYPSVCCSETGLPKHAPEIV